MKFAYGIILTLLAAIAFAPSAQAVTWEVEIEDFAFVPQSITINVGDVCPMAQPRCRGSYRHQRQRRLQLRHAVSGPDIHFHLS